jgi:hypothetical protein
MDDANVASSSAASDARLAAHPLLFYARKPYRWLEKVCTGLYLTNLGIGIAGDIKIEVRS